MKHPVLHAEERTVLGKKVKKLRRDGLVPANVYGKGIESKAVQVKLADFQEVYNQVGETGVVDLDVKDSKYPVLIKSLQMEHAFNKPLHIDFYQVNLKEKVRNMVPVALIGEAKAVTEKIGVLLQALSEVEVEALPDRIPEQIEADVTALAEVGDGITVADLKAPEGVEILTDIGVMVVNIGELAKEEEPVVEETPAESGEGASEGETKSEKKPEDKPQEKAEK